MTDPAARAAGPEEGRTAIRAIIGRLGRCILSVRGNNASPTEGFRAPGLGRQQVCPADGTLAPAVALPPLPQQGRKTRLGQTL